jgi:hypothetical protein
VSLRRKYTGLNRTPKLWNAEALVEEHTASGRSMTGRTYGRSSRENAGMSSESEVRIFTVESLRFPGEGSSAQGKSGPKQRPEGVGDGRQVEIPVLPTLV